MPVGPEPAAPATLSVVIVTYRSWGCLERCLDSLVAPGHRVAIEVVVVDNDAGDPVRAEFEERFPTVRFVAAPGNRGFAAGCNLGTAHARGELLLFLNPDVRVEPGQLDRLVDELREHPEVGILAPAQVDGHGRLQKAFDRFPTPLTTLPGGRAAARWLAPGGHPNPRRPQSALVRCDWVTGAALLVRRADLERLGGWNEAFWMYHEDVDLCRRAHALGVVVACTPRATFVHEHGGATRADEAVEIVARAETTISRHVYVELHHRGPARVAMHALVATRRMAAATFAALADLVTLGRVRRLRVRAGVWRALVAYYAGRDGSDGWVGPRSTRNRRRAAGRAGEGGRSDTCT